CRGFSRFQRSLRHYRNHVDDQSAGPIRLSRHKHGGGAASVLRRHASASPTKSRRNWPKNWCQADDGLDDLLPAGIADRDHGSGHRQYRDEVRDPMKYALLATTVLVSACAGTPDVRPYAMPQNAAVSPFQDAYETGKKHLMADRAGLAIVYFE